MPKERILFIDIAKAICIILVVIGHYVPAHSPNWYITLHDVIYTFHMPLFMFASGYIYIATKKDIRYKDFIRQKIRRLMIPYISTSFIVISIKLLSQRQAFVENPVNLYSYLKLFYAPEAGYFLWFIWALWWMFVLVPLFRTTVSRNILFGMSVLLHWLPVDFPGLFCLAQSKSMLMYFMFGIFVFENIKCRSFITNLKYSQMGIVALLFIVTEYLHFSDILLGEGKTLTNILLPFIGILFVLELSKLIVKVCGIEKSSNHFLLQTAASSYIIYLFHTTFEGFAKAVCHKLPLNNELWYIFVPEALMVISVGVILPILLYRFLLKKYAITRFLFGLK